MSNKPWLLTECVRNAWSALNENAPLRRNVLGNVLFLTLLCIALAAFGIEMGGKAPRAYSPRLLSVAFLPAEFYIFDLCLGATPRTGLAMYRDMRLLKLLGAVLRFGLLVFGAMVVFLVPGGIVFLLVKHATGMAVPLAIVFLIVLWVTFTVLLSAYSVRFMFLPVVVALRDPKPVTTLYRATKGKAWRLAKVLFWPYGVLIVASVGMEMVGLALERSMGFVALAPWFLVDACLTALICCASAVLLALVYRCFIAPQPETGAAGLGGDGAESAQEQPTFSA
ncbi:hypothetical protein [Humidesulfovibrio idahonensis]